jgi:glycosyltransferase involved in cell wall biosynthesis
VLSVTVVTLNEESNLRRCLSSVRDLATEVVVVDSGSSDGTRAVAEEFGAKWFHHDWQGFRDQKNFALKQSTQAWVLCLDADEELSGALRSQIKEILEENDPSIQGASFPRLSRFFGRWIRHGDWYPDRKLRLFRRDQGHFVGEPGHDRVEVDGPVARLSADLLHYSYPSANSFLDKLNGFSDAFLEKELANEKNWSLWQTVFRPWWRFFRGYILRRGFLDGFPGYWIAKATAFSAFVRHSRLYEHERAQIDPPSEELEQ